LKDVLEVPRKLARRISAVGLAVAMVGLVAAGSAGASSSQTMVFQDNAVFLGFSDRDPDLAMAEAKALGADSIRTFVSWRLVSPKVDARKRPAGFDVGDPDSPGYQWWMYDQLIDRARRHGLRVLLTLSPPIPNWASEEPSRCPHRIGGYRREGFSCMWKPSPRLFGQFAKAVALRYGKDARGPYGGMVSHYSLWNEPNLEHYLLPQLKTTRHGTVDVAARRYRELWTAGHEAIAEFDPANRGKVLFGETAAISSPRDTLYAALCLDQEGRPFRGRMRALQGCTRPRRLPIGGLALHPYNQEAVGSVFTRSHTEDSLPLPYLGRMHEILDRAARYGRIPPSRGIYVTEFGFQSSPPDPLGVSLPLGRHAVVLNESERLFFGDSRVKTVAQYELFDVPGREAFNTGLRRLDGRQKPAWAAFRMPLVVTELSPSLVEVWGTVRPAEGRVRLEIEVIGPGGMRTVRRPLTNRSGYYRFKLRRRHAPDLRYRAGWVSPTAETMHSRVASAGRPIRPAVE
jgi:hypothetical protein